MYNVFIKIFKEELLESMFAIISLNIAKVSIQYLRSSLTSNGK